MHGVLGRTRPTETGKYQHDDLYRAVRETLSLEKLTREAWPLESTVAAHDKQLSGTVPGFRWVRERVLVRQGEEPLQKFTDQQSCSQRLLVRMVDG